MTRTSSLVLLAAVSGLAGTGASAQTTRQMGALTVRDKAPTTLVTGGTIVDAKSQPVPDGRCS